MRFAWKIQYNCSDEKDRHKEIYLKTFCFLTDFQLEKSQIHQAHRSFEKLNFQIAISEIAFRLNCFDRHILPRDLSENSVKI